MKTIFNMIKILLFVVIVATAMSFGRWVGDVLPNYISIPLFAIGIFIAAKLIDIDVEKE